MLTAESSTLFLEKRNEKGGDHPRKANDHALSTCCCNGELVCMRNMKKSN